ncbi:MAG: hypothetical protein HRT58_03695 [Crocinitomicaceae bacterium]|nr:hypothetical protein [Flavobacteriales bacterium]NQZ34737.1 hypothetical protein [Crocinitomicaceae bacterium]
MELRIRENTNGPYVAIQTDNFEEGIKFARKNKLEQIQLKGAFGNEEHTIDFKLFESISKQLKVLSITDVNSKISVIQNLDSLYNLTGLEKLFINQKIDFELDLSRFENLTQVGLIFSKKIKNLNQASKIETLVISNGYPKEDLGLLENMTSIRTLHIYKSSKLENVNGIEKLKNLKELKLAFNNKLTDLGKINGSQVEKFHIEKCKNFTNFAVLKGNNRIKELFITELDSLQFISDMSNLEKIHFWDSKDGDLNPLMKSSSLKTAYITSNKKHYTHTQAQVEEYLNSK